MVKKRARECECSHMYAMDGVWRMEKCVLKCEGIRLRARARACVCVCVCVCAHKSN